MAAASRLVRTVLQSVDVFGADLSKFATFEALVASYGQHMREGHQSDTASIFVPVGSLLNYHPPNLDSHFSGPNRSRAEKASYFQKRFNDLEIGFKRMQHNF